MIAVLIGVGVFAYNKVTNKEENTSNTNNNSNTHNTYNDSSNVNNN